LDTYDRGATKAQSKWLIPKGREAFSLMLCCRSLNMSNIRLAAALPQRKILAAEKDIIYVTLY
jgi:hypothetical protein